MPPLDAQRAPDAPEPAAPPLDDELTALIDRWRGPLVGLLRTWRVERPVELAQDVFAEHWLSWDRFAADPDDDAAIGRWLRGIAWNLASAERRRASKRPRPMDEADPPSDTADDAAAGAERDERATLLRAAIDALPNDQRAVVLMVALEETPAARVAALLGITPRAVEGRLRRARKALAVALGSINEEVTP